MGTLFIEPGSPWENSYVESFNGKLRPVAPTKPSLSVFDELLDRDIFYRLIEAKRLIEDWRKHYNQVVRIAP